VRSIQVGGGLGSIAATPAAVWVSDFAAGTAVRIDPGSDAVAARVAVGGQPTGTALADDGTLWVANLAGHVSHLDLGGHELARVPLSSGASTVPLARGSCGSRCCGAAPSSPSSRAARM
jgi:DNA-binding beta-propeller fold protein YncE